MGQPGEQTRGRAQRSDRRGIVGTGAVAGGALRALRRRADRAHDGRAAAAARRARRRSRASHRKTVRARNVDSHCPQHGHGDTAMKIVPGAAGFAAMEADASLALAIGNFDGVHLGHAALLAEGRRRAARDGGPSAVLTFTPHPAHLFAPDRAPPLITSLERRLELLAEAEIDIAIVEPFTHAFAGIDAPAFVHDVLARQLRARDVVVGYDFSFGRDRAGTVAMLRELGGAA